MELLKYVTPDSVKTFAGSKLIIKSVREFLSQNQLNKWLLCLLGPDGCGKSTLVSLLLKDMNYEVLEIGKQSFNVQEIKTFICNKTIESFTNKRNKAIFLDDIDILVSLDKMALSKLLGLQDMLSQQHIKVVMTCNINDERKISDHKKDIVIHKMYHPSIRDTYAYLMMCFDEHHVDYSPGELLHIVTKCKGSIRQTVMSLGSTKDELIQRADETGFKDMNSFEMTKKILERRSTPSELDCFMYSDTGVIPYMMYENIPDEIDANYRLKRGKHQPTLLDIYEDINDTYINASLMEEKSFHLLDWSMHKYADILRVKRTALTLESLEKKATRVDVQYRFSQALSKMSHKNILAKKVRTVSTNANVSHAAILNATDQNVQSRNKLQPGMQQELSIQNTYEKYLL